MFTSWGVGLRFDASAEPANLPLHLPIRSVTALASTALASTALASTALASTALADVVYSKQSPY